VGKETKCIKNVVCVFSLFRTTDFFFFFLLFIIHDCVRGWKKNAPSNRLCYYYYYSLCTQGWLPGSSPSSICRGFTRTRIYYYIITLHVRAASCCNTVFTAMLTFSTTGGTTFISIAIKAARMSYHGFKIFVSTFSWYIIACQWQMGCVLLFLKFVVLNIVSRSWQL
jgi:hypothetical protein